MQPTYLPWIGYFALMQQVDRFVLLDDVKFSKQSWQQRNRVKSSSGATWLSVPVRSKGRSGQLINEVELSSDKHWQRKHYSTIESCYSKTPYWQHNKVWIEALFRSPWSRLLSLNRQAIMSIRDQLGITTPVQLSSDLETAQGRADRLVDICQKLRAEEYLSPVGSLEYLRDCPLFQEAGIELRFQNFQHPQYEQINGAFVPFMSAIDILCNALPDAAEIISTGNHPPLSIEEVVSHEP